MEVRATTDAPPATGADTIVVGLVEGEGVAHDHGGAIAPLLESGEAKARFKHLAVSRVEQASVILVGLGARDALTPER